MRVLVAALALVVVLVAKPTIVEDAVRRAGDVSLDTSAHLERWATKTTPKKSLPPPDAMLVFMLVGLAVAARAVWQARRVEDTESKNTWSSRPPRPHLKPSTRSSTTGLKK